MKQSIKERLTELGFAVWGTGLLILIVGIISLSNLGYKSYFGTRNADVDREIFENNKSYVKGMADDLAKYKYELSTNEDEVERKAIIDLIIDRCADFDKSKLENPKLERFLEDVEEGNIK